MGRMFFYKEVVVMDRWRWLCVQKIRNHEHKKRSVPIMKKNNRIKCGMIAMMAIALLSGCGNENKESSTSGAVDKQQVNIGVAQIVDHTSLNTIRDAFKEEMIALGYPESALDFQNAANDTSNLNSIMQKFAGDQKDVIVAIATPTAQAAANFAKDTPIVFSAVSDPMKAGLLTSMEKPDKGITGTSDEIQVEQILDLALTINPDIKTLGFMYNSSEDNSVSNLEKAKAYCEGKGITFVESAVTGISDVQTNAQVLVTKVDAIFVPNDNTVASAMSALANEANKAKVPVYTGADSMVMDGGFATVGIDYTELGKETARMVDAIINGKATSDIPVKVFKDDLNIYVNETVLQSLGITLPDDIKNNEKLVLIK